jgi:hypothetical protein
MHYVSQPPYHLRRPGLHAFRLLDLHGCITTAGKKDQLV